MLFVSGLAFPK